MIKEVDPVEDGEIVSLGDFVKVKVYDAGEQHVGHIQDLALEGDLSSPYVAYVGVHALWADRVGGIELVRPVEDIVLLIPWSEVQSFDEDAFRLKGVHPELPVETASGKVLLRADLLNKQMLDSRGNRIQRVDDVCMEREGQRLKVLGLEVSRGLLSSSTLRHFVDELRKKCGYSGEVEMIPLEAVQRVEEEAVIVGEVFRVED